MKRHPADYSSSSDAAANIDVTEQLTTIRSSRAKLVMDFSMATAATMTFAPLFLLIAACLKLDSRGPIFFRQKRHGIDKQPFYIWKFRTMSVLENGDSFVQATKGDQRITRVGKILRKTSLDELPQLFNVLAMEMSLVGPRPHPTSLDEQHETNLQGYKHRYGVKPGITGLAQINGCRGPTVAPGSMLRRLQFDLEYIDRWSLWLDVKIILSTPLKVMLHEDAY